MVFDWMRRALVVLASGGLLMLSGCGSGTIESQLTPTRIIAFGGAFSDLGQGGTRYTVNDGTLNNWIDELALSFGRTVAVSSVAGGTGYAVGNARVLAKPDAAGVAATRTIKEQVDAFLAGGSLVDSDLVVIESGYSDIIAEMAKVTAGTQTGDQMVAAVRQAARDFAVQIQRLEAAGGNHIMVTGPYDLGRSPWAASISQQALLTQAASAFNDEMLVALVKDGQKVLYVDTALLFNLMLTSPSAYGFTNASDAACISVDAGPGIGIGTGKVNSALCNTGTIASGQDYNTFMFADPVYPSPLAQRKFGDYAYSRIRSRW